jgi:disulfide bond formation protein DsbB
MSVTAGESAATRVAPEIPVTAAGWIWAALAVSVVGLVGSLSLSWGLNLKACPLCFYQRTFMMGLVAVLLMGLLTDAGRPARLGLLVLPLAVGGLGVAAFHVILEVTGKLECPQGLLGWGTAPKQSLATFVVLVALLVMDVLRTSEAAAGTWPRLGGAILLGGLLAAASCTSNPPPPPAPSKPYPSTPHICRPPYRPPAGS